MKANEPCCIIRSSAGMTAMPTRRPGLSERKLLAPGESPFQSVVLIDAEKNAEVEVHEVKNSESLFILYGAFEVILEGEIRQLGPGDLCFFPPGTSHGLKCIEGPGRFLVFFAPSIEKGS